MDVVFEEFFRTIEQGNGYAVAAIISPIAPANDPGRLYAFYRSSNDFDIQPNLRAAIVYRNHPQLSRAEANAWVEVFAAYWKVVGDLLRAEEAENSRKAIRGEWGNVYDSWRDLVNIFIRYHSNGTFPAWTIPCLYVASRYLRIFAIKADEQTSRVEGDVTFNAGYQDDIVSSQNKNEKLEDAARHLMRIFSLCLGDRSPIEESRKWGIYFTTNLLFKTHFKLNSLHLSKNLIRTLRAQTDLPPLENFPKSHQVTFKYYAGVIFFLEEDYAQSEEYLAEAWKLCHRNAQKNKELILTYLIPCHLLTTHTLPTTTLLASYPRLRGLFNPLAVAIKRGDLASFDAALTAGEAQFVHRRIYLTLERGRDIALRNLFRKVYLAGGYEPLKDGQTDADRLMRTRIPLAEFTAAIRLSLGETAMQGPDNDEVECLIANMIYKNLMKGYISRERSTVVLSKGSNAFPGTGL